MKTVIVSGARAVSALEIMRALHGAGWRVVAVDSMGLPPARFSQAVDRYQRIAAPRDADGFRRDVAALVAAERPDLWIATCEEIFHLAWLKEGALPSLPLFAPPLERLLLVHNKETFARVAAEVGLAPAETLLLTGRDDLGRLAPRAKELVFKPVWSRFAERVLVRPEAAELATLAPSPRDPWIAQTYLPGEEVCTCGIARDGKLLLHVAYRPKHRVRLGAGIYFEPALDPGIRAAVEALAGHLRWSGQIAFDLRRDGNGAWKAIECNPRTTSGAHLARPDALAGAFEGRKDREGRMTEARMIGLAMWFFGLPAAARTGRIGEWWHDHRRARDVVSVVGDRGPGLGQHVFLVEVAVAALRHRVSLTRAVSMDLEWNGGEAER